MNVYLLNKCSLADRIFPRLGLQGKGNLDWGSLWDGFIQFSKCLVITDPGILLAQAYCMPGYSIFSPYSNFIEGGELPTYK